jgi:spoIIIJ-associated protein
MERESIEVRARTTDEAIRSALEQLGVSREEVEVEILAEGRSGVFGVGSQDARVRVSLISEEFEEDEEWDEEQPAATSDEDAATARDTLEQLLDLMEFPNVVTIRDIEHEKGNTTIVLDVAGDDVGLLIGRHGETLSSLQYLVNACLSSTLPRHTRVVVDVEHYRDRREQSLRGIAIRAADRARRDGHPVTLQPMPPNERRIVHLTLQSSPFVTTESTGDGAERRVVVSPKPNLPPQRRPSYGYRRG